MLYIRTIKEIEQNLRSQTEKLKQLVIDLKKFQLMFENVSEHMIITDPDGYIMEANKSAEFMTGFLKEEMIGNRPSLWGKQMEQSFYKNMWHTIKAKKKTFFGEIINRRKNGERYVAEIIITSILDSQGAPIFFVGIERDITQRKEIDKAKTEFISLASHQLRTPLTAINLMTEMILNGMVGEVDGEAKKYLKDIHKEIKSMSELIETFLNISRIELGKFPVEPTPLRLKQAIDEVLFEFSSKIKDKKLKLIKEYKEDVPVIKADKKIIKMALDNLISNAVKYTPENGAITVGIEKNGKDLIVKVSDTGCGIPEDQQSRLFTKMFRARNVVDGKESGFGLGLYLAKSAMEQSGGKIWFESRENKGATFYFSTPLKGMKKNYVQ